MALGKGTSIKMRDRENVPGKRRCVFAKVSEVKQEKGAL